MPRHLVTPGDTDRNEPASADFAVADAGRCAAGDNGTSSHGPTEREGVVRTTRRHPGNRYDYDFTLCAKPRDCQWAQIDTGSDAWYFGQWANPFLRTVIAFAEGDETTTECCDDHQFVAELQRIRAWHETHDQWKGIDAWNGKLAARFIDAGAGDLLHPRSY